MSFLLEYSLISFEMEMTDWRSITPDSPSTARSARIGQVQSINFGPA